MELRHGAVEVPLGRQSVPFGAGTAVAIVFMLGLAVGGAKPAAAEEYVPGHYDAAGGYVAPHWSTGAESGGSAASSGAGEWRWDRFRESDPAMHAKKGKGSSDSAPVDSSAYPYDYSASPGAGEPVGGSNYLSDPAYAGSRDR